MPSTKKRINLTVPDPIYDQLQAYKELNGISNDAGACLQLIVQQLKAQETMQLFLQTFWSYNAEEREKLTVEGTKMFAKMSQTEEFKKTLPFISIPQPKD